MSKKYKVLITGSSGMLGVDLCRELARGYELVGMDLVRESSFVNRESRKIHRLTNHESRITNLKPKRFYPADITDRKRVLEIIAKTRPDFVIHAAAWTDVDGCELDAKKAYKINSEGAGNVALACKASGAALVYISTDFVFDGKKGNPYKETDRTGPISVYGDSKLKGEDLIKRHLKNHFIIRTSWLYGRFGKNFVDTIISKAKTESCLRVVRDQVGSPTYTRDLARAIRALLEIAVSAKRKTQNERRTTNDERRATGYGIYHVSNSGKVSWYDYAREILKPVGFRTKVVPITSGELDRPAKRPAMSVMDNAKFIKFTGYKMPDWKIALKQYLLG